VGARNLAHGGIDIPRHGYINEEERAAVPCSHGGTDLLRAQVLNFGMRFEDAEGDLRIVNAGTPPTARVVVDSGEEG
jgi:hypothetical protein